MVHCCNRLLQDGGSIPPASPQNQPLRWCYRAAQALVHTDQRYKRLKKVFVAEADSPDLRKGFCHT